jgi:hypothetical protein
MDNNLTVLSFFCISMVYFASFAGCLNASDRQPDLVTVIVTPPTEYPRPVMTHIVQTPTLSYAYGSAKCPIPPLIFNNSQEFTTLHTGLHILRPGEKPPSDAFSIPYGSVIYHSSNATTRIFDPSGKQILIVNDTESSVLTATGTDAATTYFSNIRYSDFGMNLTRIGTGDIQYYVNQSDAEQPCMLIKIYSGWQDPFFPGNLGSKLGK